MRLLLYGSLKNPNTTASFFIKHLDESVDYEILRFPDEFSELLESKVYKVLYRLVPWIIVRAMDKSFIKHVEEFKPTVVLIFKGMEISKWSLARVKRKGVKLVNYNFDHPLRYFSRGTGNQFVREAIPFYDLHITYSQLIAEELKRECGVNTACIPFGFHLSSEGFHEVICDNRNEIKRACFVGNPDELRIRKLKELISNSIPISLYGFGWDKIFQPSDLVQIHMPQKENSFWAEPMEFWKVLRQYRIQLNFFRPHNEGSHNLRTFEVPAVGGILLTPESDEQKMFFKGGTEVFFYADSNELLDKCKMLLTADDRWILNIRQNARLRSTSGDYSYYRRTRDLTCLLDDLAKV